MASQVGNVPHVGTRAGMRTESSTKCANDGVAMNGLKAGNPVRIAMTTAATRNTAQSGAAEKCGETAGTNPDGPRTAKKCVSNDQHACRLHGIRDVRKSVITLRKRVRPYKTMWRTLKMIACLAIGFRACLPIEGAA
jgi:hypothetical protein